MRWMVLALVSAMWASVAVGQEEQLAEFLAVIPRMSGGVAVVDFVDPAPQPEFGKPKEGNKLIAVQLVFLTFPEVTTSVKVNPMFAELKCSDMAIRNSAMGGAPDPALASAEMKEPEDRLMGWVAFEIPVDLNASECKLNYGVMDKSRWIRLAAAEKKQSPTEAPK